MTILNIIRDQDWFGFPIALNFNKKGSTHKSIVGGGVSIFLKTIILIYLLSLFNALVFNENDSNNSVKVLLDPEDLGDVRLNETGFMPVISI